jgi:hypothetical protein
MVCEVQIENGIEVPAPARLERERTHRYGRVSGLADEELADPAELERQVFREMWGPILALPKVGSRRGIQPNVDESGGLDWGAFATVDFRRLTTFDPTQSRRARLREALKHAIILLEIVLERIPFRSKFVVLKYLRMGVITIEHLTHPDMVALAKWVGRVRRIRQQLADLEGRRR